MKKLLIALLRDMECDLNDMKKSQMTLTERIKYEKAMTRLKIAKNICYDNQVIE